MMHQGVIRNIRDDKDYGFIISGVNRDIFLHKSQYRGDWDELLKLHAQNPVKVEFEIEESDKGLRAINCKVIL